MEVIVKRSAEFSVPNQLALEQVEVDFETQIDFVGREVVLTRRPHRFVLALGADFAVNEQFADFTGDTLADLFTELVEILDLVIDVVVGILDVGTLIVVPIVLRVGVPNG